MDERDWLAERFEEHRTHLRAVAYRMLGSLSEADDAFLAAAREGAFERLVAVLDPDVVSRGDFGPGVPLREARGAEAVASNAIMFQRIGLEARPALVNGAVGAVSLRDGKPFSIG